MFYFENILIYFISFYIQVPQFVCLFVCLFVCWLVELLPMSSFLLFVQSIVNSISLNLSISLPSFISISVDHSIASFHRFKSKQSLHDIVKNRICLFPEINKKLFHIIFKNGRTVSIC